MQQYACCPLNAPNPQRESECITRMISLCHESYCFLPLLCPNSKSQSKAVSCLCKHLTLCQKMWYRIEAACRSNASQWVLGLMLVGAIARFVWQRMTGPSSVRFPGQPQASPSVFTSSSCCAAHLVYVTLSQPEQCTCRDDAVFVRCSWGSPPPQRCPFAYG